MPSTVALTTLLIAVPEAEDVVRDLRLRLDPSAAQGVPAHVTVLYPFVPAAAVDDAVLGRVARVVGAAPAFGYRFARTAWFDERVLWLAPDDDEPFRRLTEAVHAEFPEHPPFEGMFDDVVPHLTVGDSAPRAAMAAAEQQVLPRLPVRGHASEVVMLAQDGPGGRWSRRAAFPLSRR